METSRTTGAHVPGDGGGGTLALLGGMRAVVAGAFWLRANLAWERQDPEATWAAIRRAVAADDRPVYFWLNGARMMAYDFPTWSAAAMPAAVRQRQAEQCARRAEEFLRCALKAHPGSPEIRIELGMLRLRASGDRRGGALWFRQAAQLPGAPPYAARIAARLWRELGESGEELACLRRAQALAGSDTFQRAWLAGRIEELENKGGRRKHHPADLDGGEQRRNAKRHQ